MIDRGLFINKNLSLRMLALVKDNANKFLDRDIHYYFNFSFATDLNYNNIETSWNNFLKISRMQFQVQIVQLKIL